MSRPLRTLTPAIGWVLVGLMGLAGLAALGAAVKEGAVDATPAEMAQVPTGAEVHLRSLRDRSAALRLASGEVLYPSAEPPVVFVDCGSGGCAGELRGRLDELTVEGALPPGWPSDAGRQVRVVRVGRWGRARQRYAAVAAGLLSGALWIALLLVVRRRRGNRRGRVMAGLGGVVTVVGGVVAVLAIAYVLSSPFHRLRMALFLDDPTFLLELGPRTLLPLGLAAFGLTAGPLMVALGLAPRPAEAG